MTMLTDAQIASFEADGFLVIEDVLGRADVLDPLVSEYETLLDGLVADWVRAGELDASVQSLPFGEQLVTAHAAGLEVFQPMDISLPLEGIEADTPMHLGPAAFCLLVNEDLLDIAESLIGPEITSCPIQHVRVKPREERMRPGEVRAHLVATRFHQDRAVGREDADDTEIVTVWVSVTEADEENGCLLVVPGSHRGDMVTHCPAPQIGIPDALIEPGVAKPLPIGAGGVVLLHPMTIHGSLPNRSDRLRWSFDLRYNRTGDQPGRPQFPDFVARSRRSPETELRDPERWAELWRDARANLATGAVTGPFHRWDADAPICA